MTAEEERLREAREGRALWKRWGPYLSERQWGTVREDYSAGGTAWDYFPHDHARSRAYRWGEDGLAGISDEDQRLCFALALWNGNDPILKERLFGLTGPEGNHGEDVKEYYFYLDATPTHSYAKYLYKYPQRAFPYADLVDTNRRRGRDDPEYELLDTGIFADDRYFDVFVEYAKAAPHDILIRITAVNRGPDPAALHLLPSLWFRNTWSWCCDDSEPVRRRTAIPRPRLAMMNAAPGMQVIAATHAELGSYWLAGEGAPLLLFTENETNNRRLYDVPNAGPFVKDGIGEFVVHGNQNAVNPHAIGTKAAALYRQEIPAGGEATVRLRLSDSQPSDPPGLFGEDFDAIFNKRLAEADAFYARLAPPGLSEDARSVQRQALAGLLWSKQFYYYDVREWLDGDPAYAPPPSERRRGRNAAWPHVSCTDILSLPDKWEYPWFAAWDLAFHTMTFALVDPDFAKRQLLLLCREWYMHPNGQLPAYEWAFDDVNPPVHAWAALRVYQIERRLRGQNSADPGDTDFLERIFHKLLLNFTWWVNRKDAQGNNVFEGGFLGLDNIGVFDRSAPLPTGGYIEQSDGTAWMAMYCLNMLAIALELARLDPIYQDVAVKFAEHFIYIAHALTNMGEDGLELWDEADGFFYDVLHLPDGTHLPLKVRSMVGLIPLFAVEAFDPDTLAAAPDFHKRIAWFLQNKPELARGVAHLGESGEAGRGLFSIVNEERLRRILRRLLDEDEFLSPHGIRALSRYHRDHPYILPLRGGGSGSPGGAEEYRVDYQPAESTIGCFGGNSNWRGPVWWPVNYLLIESLQRFAYVLGDTFQMEFPTGSGRLLTLDAIAAELSRWLTRTFLRDPDGRRPVYGGTEKFQSDPYWRDHLLFFEYFHGDSGAGLGASHQTGWTSLVAKLIEQSGE